MRYLPKSPADRKEMLDAIGVASIDELFETIPGEYRLQRDLKIPRQHGESEVLDRFRAFAGNIASGDAAELAKQPAMKLPASFLGAGAYRHYRPVIIDSLASPAAAGSVQCTVCVSAAYVWYKFGGTVYYASFQNGSPGPPNCAQCKNGTIDDCLSCPTGAATYSLFAGSVAGSNCASTTVPCGIDPIRTTVGGSFGSVVCGTCAQMPGSMCRPAPVLFSLICCI